MRAGEQGAVILGIAAEAGDFAAELAGDLAALVGAGAEQLGKAAAVDRLGGFLIAVDAVDGGGDQAIQRADVVAGLGHCITPG